MTVAILVLLFLVQPRGTERIGKDVRAYHGGMVR